MGFTCAYYAIRFSASSLKCLELKLHEWYQYANLTLVNAITRPVFVGNLVSPGNGKDFSIISVKLFEF
jgi:hypothetical protein